MKECEEGGDEGKWSRGMVKDDGEGGEEERLEIFDFYVHINPIFTTLTTTITPCKMNRNLPFVLHNFFGLRLNLA